MNIECPWPESVWGMTDEQYMELVPDPKLRTAISGYLMRKGWEVAMVQNADIEVLTLQWCVGCFDICGIEQKEAIAMIREKLIRCNQKCYMRVMDT